jgi:hypothetical protein
MVAIECKRMKREDRRGAVVFLSLYLSKFIGIEDEIGGLLLHLNF